MWTWEQERRRPEQEPAAQLGRVTLSGAVTGANLGGERRWLEVCAPGGYTWRPRADQQVLVLKLPDGSGQSCVAGVLEGYTELEPGEVRLEGGSCAILLGSQLELTGEVKLNGQTLENYIRGIVAKELGG